MKKKFLTFVAFAAAFFTVKSSYAQTTLPGIISTDFTCVAGETYIIDGKVYVNGGATLFIEEGVTLKGVKKATPELASALVITRTGRIEATGSAENPIVFTSNEPVATRQSGDWGGVVILGSAPLNRVDQTIEGINLPTVPPGVDINYGGGGAGLGNPNENKGIMNYVRIEYAGAAVSPNNELNGLTMGGVGRGTFIDFVEVLAGADDAFEWFGGTVNCKHLIAVAPDDDAFDFDFGFTGNIQFAISVLRNEKPTYSSDPNGIESDNNGTGALDNPRTNPTISNMTVIGFEDSTTAGVLGKRSLNGARWRRATSLTVRNSIFMGFPTGVAFESAATQADAARFANNIVHGFRVVSSGVALPATNTGILGEVGFSNETIDLVDPFNLTFPDFRPSLASPAAAGASFTGFVGTPANFFQVTTYRGAFSTGTNWNATWSRFF
jgi:hypothetical protein